MADYRNVLEDTNFKEAKWSYQALQEMLLKVCDDIDNCKGEVSYFQLPSYLREFWADHSTEFYEKGLRAERYAKYLELKKEFENTL